MLVALILFHFFAQCVVSEPKTILFISCYQKSPIISLQGLAEEMKSRGHRVLFSVTDDDRHLVTSESVGVEFLSGGPPVLEAPMAFGIDDLWTGEVMFARTMYKHLLANLKAQNITLDLIVLDPLAIAGEALGHTLGVNSVQAIPHLSTLGWIGSEATAGHPVIISGIASSKMGLAGRLKNSVLMFASQWFLPLLRGSIQNGFRQEVGLPAQWLESQNPYGRTKFALLGVTPGFEIPRAYPPMIQSTGPWLPRSTPVTEKDKVVREFLTRPSALPLVYISIGTNSDHTAESAGTILRVIHMGVSKGVFRALWSLKEKHRSLLNATELAAVSGLQDVLITSFVPQLLAIEHAAVFVSHCGLASVQESLFLATPLLCIPMMLVSDQPTIAARIEELGLGLWLDRREEEISDFPLFTSILQLTTPNNAFKIQALRWSQLMRKLDGRKVAGDWLEVVLTSGIESLLKPVPDYNWDVWAVFFLAAYLVRLFLGWLGRKLCGSKKSDGAREVAAGSKTNAKDSKKLKQQ